MKIEFAWGLFPIIYLAKESIPRQNKSQNKFLFVSFVEDINDKLQTEHEKIVVKYNYIITMVILTSLFLTYIINFYLMFLFTILYGLIVYVLYFTDVGEYNRDVIAYSKVVDLYVQEQHFNTEQSLDFIANRMLKSTRYGKYANFLGKNKIIDDLKNNINKK